MIKYILYIRSGPYQVDPNTYNLQEIGLATAFSELGIQCDVMYYHKKKNYDQIIEKNGYSINVFWKKGIRLLRSGIYLKILKRDFLAKYDAVIISEYSQVMAVLLSSIHANVYIYNGPYYNLFKFPFMEPVYDALFCKRLNERTEGVFCKTQIAKEYLEKKGFTKCNVVGVGLDTEKFDAETEVEKETTELLTTMENHRNLVYVGSISKRKNVELLVKVFNQLKTNPENRDIQFIVIGKDEGGYLEKCKNLISPQAKDSVVYRRFIKNAQLKFIYQKADVFMLPSIQEIFGMVLLEAMYFGVPTVASGSAGAKTLIEDGVSGKIVEGFDEGRWTIAIQELLSDGSKRKRMGQAATERIQTQFMWSSIAKKMLRGMANE